MSISNQEINFLWFSAAAVSLNYLSLLRKRKKRKRLVWSKPWLQRRNAGSDTTITLLIKELRIEDESSYTNFIRMCEDHFSEILNLIKRDILKKDTNMRECISPEHR